MLVSATKKKVYGYGCGSACASRREPRLCMYSVISGSSMILTLLRSARMKSAPMRCSCKGEIADAEASPKSGRPRTDAGSAAKTFRLSRRVPETAQRERECKVREMRCAVAEEGLGFIGFNDNPFAPPMSPATLAARGAMKNASVGGEAGLRTGPR